MKAIKTISNLAGCVLISLAASAAIIFIAVMGALLIGTIREGCTTERSSETMNLVTCKSGSHYETR